MTLRLRRNATQQTRTEDGVARFEVDLWYGLLAPAGTPAGIFARLADL
jgi:hypothetical protein